MGLYKNDTVIRRRIKQKYEFLAEDVRSLEEPSDSELQEYLDAHEERYAEDTELSFKHVFFSYDKHGIDAEKVAAENLSKTDATTWDSLGDSSRVLESEYAGVTQFEVARVFGAEFAKELGSIAVSTWSGPHQSGYGEHLVFIEMKEEGEKPELEQVRELVLEDYQSAQREKFLESLYVELSKNTY